MAKRPLKPSGLGDALGTVMVNLEQQLFRGRPTVEERYERRDEVTSTAADGSRITVSLEPPAPTGPPALPGLTAESGPEPPA